MDLLRKLRSSPSNFIIFSMVGLVACPLTAFWGLASLYKYTNASFHFLKFFSMLINVSVGHKLLLSIDRFFAVVTPLQYRAKVTRKRICIISVACWIYFLLFGFVFSLLQKHYALMHSHLHRGHRRFHFVPLSQAPKHWMTSMQGYLAKWYSREKGLWAKLL